MRSVFGVVPLLVTFLVSTAQAGNYDVPSRRIALPIHLHSRQSLHGRSAPNASAIAPVTYTDDKQSYYVVIQTGEINFRVALDTGSSDLWVASSSCSTAACNSVPRYPLEYHSPTFVSVNNNSTAFGVHFADGTGASGFVARESVTFSNLTIANQAFGLVTDSNVTLDDYISGILGLGFPRLSNISNSVANATPFFATLAEQGRLDYPLFGVSLTRNSTGTLTIGAIDSSIVKNVSDMGWNEVVPFSPVASESNTSSYLQWAIRLSSFAVNNTALTPIPTYPNFTSNSSVALLDIGTSGLYGPYQDVTRLFSMIDGSRLVDSNSGQWALPCDTPDTMSFTFGHQNFTLQPSDYLIGETFGDPNFCLSWPRAAPPSSDGIDWQLGAAFLRTVYSVFSYGINTKEPPMIGLYPLYAANTTVEPASAVSSFLSSESATIATTLPNVILPTPTYTTPAYAFNTSVPAPIGEIVSSGLATSTYSALLGTHHPNATALPGVSGLSAYATVVTTDTAGLIHTYTSAITRPSIVLGVPPGWNAATRIRAPLFSMAFFSFLLPLITFIIAAHIIL